MYKTRENPPKEVQNALHAYDMLTQRLLYARGITTQTEAEIFFKKEWVTINPHQYRDMGKAVKRLLGAIEAKETIGIFSDYDCDGIPAAAALFSTLRAFGHDRIIYCVPDRNKEGFGLNKRGTRTMIEGGASVVCVLDCGITNQTEIAEMEQKGIHTILIDHHLAEETLPNAYAIINPATEGNKPPHPCAAGVTYITIQALIQEAQKKENIKKPPDGWEKWQLDIVGLATLSDMVPLRGINRQLVQFGLYVFRKSPRPGIQALCKKLKLDQTKITQDDLSFSIIPRINAASRMGEAKTSFKLLTTDSIEEAMALTEILSDLNNKRKSTVATMVREAQKQAEVKDKRKAVWVFGNRGWKPSLVGLVANKIADTHNKTVFVWGQGGTEEKAVIKGSCRSAHCDIFALMKNTPKVFAEAGGHKQAGGFTLNTGAEVSLEDALNETNQTKEDKPNEHIVDGEFDIHETISIHQLCEKFAPFGMENNPIIIAIPQCTVYKKTVFGKNNNHIRYLFTDGAGYIDGITFFAKGNKNIAAEQGQTLRAVIGHLETNTFKNKPQIRVVKCVV